MSIQARLKGGNDCHMASLGAAGLVRPLTSPCTSAIVFLSKFAVILYLEDGTPYFMSVECS